MTREITPPLEDPDKLGGLTPFSAPSSPKSRFLSFDPVLVT